MPEARSVVVFLSACFPPLLTLIPSGSNLSSPLQFRRNEEFSVSSTIELNCNNSLALQFQWSIRNCSLFTCVNVSPIAPTLLSTTGDELFIPSRTLPFGLYQLQLRVTLNISSSLSTTRSVFVRILPGKIVANLLPLGTSMVTSGSAAALQLNPGLYSLDLNANDFNASDWNYHYFCRISRASNSSNLNGSFVSIAAPPNVSCLNNRPGREEGEDLLPVRLFNSFSVK